MSRQSRSNETRTVQRPVRSRQRIEADSQIQSDCAKPRTTTHSRQSLRRVVLEARINSYTHVREISDGRLAVRICTPLATAELAQPVTSRQGCSSRQQEYRSVQGRLNQNEFPTPSTRGSQTAYPARLSIWTNHTIVANCRRCTLCHRSLKPRYYAEERMRRHPLRRIPRSNRSRSTSYRDNTM